MGLFNNKDALKDVRIVHVDTSTILALHQDINHRGSHNDSTTIHMDTWKSKDYLPGAIHDGPWKKPIKCEEVSNAEGEIMGKLGECKCLFDKGNCEFKFGIDYRNSRSKGTNVWSKKPSKSCQNRLDKEHLEKQGIRESVEVKMEEKNKTGDYVKKHRETLKRKREDDKSN